MFGSCGFPHSEICGSKCMCHSPQLIAAYHVLHRRLVPRHSPCALSNLTYFCSQVISHLKGYGSLSLRLNPITHFDEKILQNPQDSLYLSACLYLDQQDLKKISFVFSFVLLLVFLCSCQGTMLAASLVRENVVGLNGLEPSTSRLSGARSNQLSYKPIELQNHSGPED